MFRLTSDGTTPLQLLLETVMGSFFPGYNTEKLLVILEAAEKLHTSLNKDSITSLSNFLETKEGVEFLEEDMPGTRITPLIRIRQYAEGRPREPIDPVLNVERLFEPFIER